MASGTPQNLCNHNTEYFCFQHYFLILDNKNVRHTNSYLNSVLYHYKLYFKCSHSSKNTEMVKMYCMAVMTTNAQKLVLVGI